MNVGTPFIGPLTREDTETAAAAAAAEDAANRELVQGVLALPDELFNQTMRSLISLDPYPGLNISIVLGLRRLDTDIRAYLEEEERQKTTGIETAISRKLEDGRLLFYRLRCLPSELFAKIIEYLDPNNPADGENRKTVCCMYYGDSFDPKLNCLRYLESPEFKKHLMQLGFSSHFLDRMQAYLADAGKGSEEDRIAYVVHRVSRLWGTLKSDGKINSNLWCVKPGDIEKAIHGALQGKKLDEIRGRGLIISIFQEMVRKWRNNEIAPLIGEDLIKSLETIANSTGHLLSDSWWSNTFFPWIWENCNHRDFDHVFRQFHIECSLSYPSCSSLWVRSFGALSVTQKRGEDLLRKMMLQAVKDNDDSRLREIIRCLNTLPRGAYNYIKTPEFETAIQRAIEFDYRECLQTLLLNGGAENCFQNLSILQALLGSDRGYRLQIFRQISHFMNYANHYRIIEWALKNGLIEELDCLLRPDNINQLTVVNAEDLFRVCIERLKMCSEYWGNGTGHPETVISQIKKLFQAFQSHKDYQTIVSRIEDILIAELDASMWLENINIPHKGVDIFIEQLILIFRIVLAISNDFASSSLVSKLCNLVNTPEKRERIFTETMDKIRELSNSNESLEPLRQALKAGEPQSGDRTLS